ncbi:MAG: helix-turn-helix transcriptional regulator [Chloracidobacterium sp.]|nr:helix-turn-helix transcriptional regulator [Chloracidobacterium sp.]
MTGEQLKEARILKGWNQEHAARRLGVSQTYLSLLEKGKRRAPEKLVARAVRVYGLSESLLPVTPVPDQPPAVNEDKLASELAALGYPGLSHLKFGGKKKNPAELLLSALGNDNLDSRLVEALPWVVLKFPDLNWRWLAQAARMRDLQNRLGYVTNVARRLAELRGEREKARLLAAEESTLERSRLAREDTLCHESLTEAEKKWLRKNRPPEARHWRLLTDLSPEQLDHAA